MSKKFRLTKKLFDTDDVYEKTLAFISGMPVITAAMDLPETATSVFEDGYKIVERVSDKVYDFFNM